MAKKQVERKSKAQSQSKTKSQPVPEAPSSGLDKVKAFFWQHTWGKCILVCLLMVLVFCLNLLLSQDQLDIFSLLWGVEILLLIMVGWGLFLYRRYQEREDKH